MSKTFLIGGELSVNRLGFGAMRLCGQPGNFGPYADWEGGKALLRRAVELGVNFIDTAHPYGPGFNEELIAEALSPYGNVIVTTKGGVEKTAPDKVFPDGKPESLRRFCELSLKRLKLETIPLYQLHRPDPAVPFAESVSTLAKLRKEGKIRHIGLSNVTLERVQEAQTIVPIASVQNRYNVSERADDEVVFHCKQHDIAYLPWGPLAARPFDREAPLAGKESVLVNIAERLGVTPSQIALAWLLHRASNIIVIPGTTSISHLEQNMAAAEINLSSSDLAELQDINPDVSTL